MNVTRTEAPSAADLILQELRRVRELLSVIERHAERLKTEEVGDDPDR